MVEFLLTKMDNDHGTIEYIIVPYRVLSAAQRRLPSLAHDEQACAV